MAPLDHRADRAGLRCSPHGRRGCSHWRPRDQLGTVSSVPQPVSEILTAKAFRDLLDAIRTPGSFGVNDSNPAFSAALLLRQLSDDGHGVGELSLAASYRPSVGNRMGRR